MRYIQRCKQMQWDINKDVNKCNEIYTKDKQRCKQMQWDINKDVNKCNEMYTKM